MRETLLPFLIFSISKNTTTTNLNPRGELESL